MNDRIKLFSAGHMLRRRGEADMIVLRLLEVREVRMREINVGVCIVLFAAIARNIVAPELHETGIHPASLSHCSKRAETGIGTIG